MDFFLSLLYITFIQYFFSILGRAFCTGDFDDWYSRDSKFRSKRYWGLTMIPIVGIFIMMSSTLKKLK